MGTTKTTITKTITTKRQRPAGVDQKAKGGNRRRCSAVNNDNEDNDNDNKDNKKEDNDSKDNDNKHNDNKDNEKTKTSGRWSKGKRWGSKGGPGCEQPPSSFICHHVIGGKHVSQLEFKLN